MESVKNGKKADFQRKNRESSGTNHHAVQEDWVLQQKASMVKWGVVLGLLVNTTGVP